MNGGGRVRGEKKAAVAAGREKGLREKQRRGGCGWRDRKGEVVVEKEEIGE